MDANEVLLCHATHTPRDVRHSAPYLADAIRGDRVPEAFELEHLVLRVDVVAQATPRLLAQHDLVRSGLPLEAGREISRLAEDAQVGVLAEAADDGGTGGDADAERDSHVASAIAHRHRGAQRVAGVI